MTEELSEPDQHYDRVVDELATRFAGVHEREVVERAVADARAALEADARVKSYLPLLTLKLACDRLAKPTRRLMWKVRWRRPAYELGDARCPRDARHDRPST